MIVFNDIPIGLSLPALVVALMLGGYPLERWRDLIDDARALFYRNDHIPAVNRAKRKARR